MNVVNLGEFGKPRPSILSGLAEGLQKKREQDIQQQTRDVEYAKLKREVEKHDFDKEMKLAEHGKQVADGLSMKLYTMPGGPDGPDAKIMLKGLEEVVKGLKKTNPEYIGDQGQFMPTPPKDIYKDKFYQQMTDAKGRLQANAYPKTEEGANQMAMDYQIAGRFNEASIKKASAILEDETLNPSAHPGSDDWGKIITNKLKSVFGIGNSQPAAQANPSPMTAGLGAPPAMAPQAEAPQQGGGSVQTDPNDPLSARGV